MADGVVSSGVSSHILPKNKGKISEYVCNKCSVYETQLKEALEELESARMIIDILQKELHLRQQRKRVATTRSVCKNSVNKTTQRNGFQFLPKITQSNQIKIINLKLHPLINSS